LRKGRAELQGFLTKRLGALELDAHVQALLRQGWAAIFTTNYDRVIERAYELLADPPQTPVPISATSQLVETDPRFEVPVYHVHGSLFAGERPSISPRLIVLLARWTICRTTATLCDMGDISVRDLRNDTGGVLRRVEAGETLIVHSNRRAVAQIVPLVERPTWLPAAEFFSRVLAHPADPGLRDDLAALQPDALEDL